MTTDVRGDAHAYLVRMRTALDDLPAAEVEEILDDVGPHLDEIAEELTAEAAGETLADRLGEPESYAAELRAAAGYPARTSAPGAPSGSTSALVRAAVWSLALVSGFAFLFGLQADHHLFGLFYDAGFFYLRGVSLAFFLMLLAAAVLLIWAWALARPDLVERTGELPEVRRLLTPLRAPATSGTGRALAFLGSLQTAWWLLRGSLLALLIPLQLGVSSLRVAAVVLVLPVVLLSVLLGQRSKTERRWLWLALPINAFAAGATLLAATLVLGGWPFGYASFSSTGQSTSVPAQGLEHDGTPVQNLFPFDANGKPLTGVYLYDQDGQPLVMTEQFCDPNNSSTQVDQQSNEFPLQQVGFSGNLCMTGSAVPSPLTRFPSAPSTQPSASTPTATTTQPTATTQPSR